MQSYSFMVHLSPVLLATLTLIGVVLADAIELLIGTAVAVSESTPRLAGFQEQVATISGEDPLVVLFLHPAITTPLALKVTLDATVTLAMITIAVL